MSRKFTKLESVMNLLKKVKGDIDRLEKDTDQTSREKMESLIFYFLATLDGCGEYPIVFFHLGVSKEDQEWYKSRGEDYYPSGIINERVELHSLWHPLLQEDETTDRITVDDMKRVNRDTAVYDLFSKYNFQDWNNWKEEDREVRGLYGSDMFYDFMETIHWNEFCCSGQFKRFMNGDRCIIDGEKK